MFQKLNVKFLVYNSQVIFESVRRINCLELTFVCSNLVSIKSANIEYRKITKEWTSLKEPLPLEKTLRGRERERACLFVFILINISDYNAAFSGHLTLSPMVGGGGGLRGSPFSIFAIDQDQELGPWTFWLFLKPSWANAETKILSNFYFLPPYGPPKKVHP